jgi:hypothetical protein
MKCKLLLIVPMMLLLFGCTPNPFIKYYQDRTGGIDISQSPNFILSTADTRLYKNNFSALQSDIEKMEEDGYLPLGESSFNGGRNVDPNDAIEQARNIHAEVILFYAEYESTKTGVMPWQSQDRQSSTTTYSGDVYGSRGYGSYNGTANTTTYGTRTTYIPYSVDRYNYGATYWAKGTPPVLGLIVKDLTPEVRQKNGKNIGVDVQIVIKNSPAFRADIFKGDILKKINNVELYEGKDFHEGIKKFAGQKVVIELLRDGKEIRKSIQLNEAPPKPEPAQKEKLPNRTGQGSQSKTLSFE